MSFNPITFFDSFFLFILLITGSHILNYIPNYSESLNHASGLTDENPYYQWMQAHHIFFTFFKFLIFFIVTLIWISLAQWAWCQWTGSMANLCFIIIHFLNIFFFVVTLIRKYQARWTRCQWTGGKLLFHQAFKFWPLLHTLFLRDLASQPGYPTSM